MIVDQIQNKHPVICFRRGFFLPTNVQRKRKEERNHIYEAEASTQVSAEDKETKSMASDQTAENREEGLSKSFRLNLNVLFCDYKFWDAGATDFTLRSCMNDSHGQIFSLEKVVRRADYDLLILFFWKDRTKRHLFHYVGYRH